ncbi:helix-turn-helix domain-containing protein [Clostridium neuense]|uniref:Helix-turn-helix domain-containing protein n=1 Tax=Clostridium neuense TaxID=1728934 RepID=A0ABW8TDN5_9CLOT
MEGKNFGLILKKVRQDRGLSMSDLEKAIGISSAYISRLENQNRDNISLQYFVKLCKIFKLSSTLIWELYPDCFIDENLQEICTLDEVISKSNFKFAEKDSNIDIKFSFQKIIKQLEKYILLNTRDSQIKLLIEIDELKDKILKQS